MSDTFNAELSRTLRDEGLGRVALNSYDFMSLALIAIGILPHGEYTGEKIRADLIEKGITPHHPNAWGALISAAVRKGMLKETGRYVAMTATKSHARKTQVYAI